MTFAISDLVARYRGSVLGFLWAIIEPLLILTILYFVFTNVFRSTIENYAIYLLLGIVMWSFFTRATSMGMSSFIAKAGIITKTHLPREVLPISACITALIMSLFEFIVLFGFFAIFNFIPPITIIVLPALLGIEFVLSLGIALALCVLNVRYRDVQYIWGVVTYGGFFAVPIFYSLSIVPENVRNLLLLNPMAQIIEMSHVVVLNGLIPVFEDVTYTLITSFIILLIGIVIFRHFNFKVIEEL